MALTQFPPANGSGKSMQKLSLHALITSHTLSQEHALHFLALAMISSNNELAILASSDRDGDENPTDQDSVGSGSEGLVPSDGSHLGSISADSIDPDSIREHLADGLVDQAQQERRGEALNLAVKMEILGPEVGPEDPVDNTDAIGEDKGAGTIPKGRSIAHNIFNNQQAVFL